MVPADCVNCLWLFVFELGAKQACVGFDRGFVERMYFQTVSIYKFALEQSIILYLFKCKTITKNNFHLHGNESAQFKTTSCLAAIPKCNYENNSCAQRDRRRDGQSRHYKLQTLFLVLDAGWIVCLFAANSWKNSV